MSAPSPAATALLYTAAEMREAESGHDVEAMMERAGRAVAEAVMRRWPDAREVACVCGGGANGGDGRIAARVLEGAGRRAPVVEPGGSVGAAAVIVDALFGTGFRGEPRAEAAALIEATNAGGVPVLAVDVPSGVDASTGEVSGVAVDADVTVTMHGPKVGLHVAPGRFHAGEIEVAAIGIDDVPTAHRLVLRDALRAVPPKRPQDNKYSAGAVLVVGGSPGMTGAVCLAAEAAFRADAGYVAVAVPERSLPVVEARLLEAVKRTWAEVDVAAAKASAVAIGPGLGRGDEGRALVRRLLDALDVPVVLDADALDALEPLTRRAPTLLTPHEGELARLLGEESGWVRAHRLAAARRAADELGAIVLLKGADTIVAEPGAAGALVHSADVPALATAGTGDVLTGVLAAFLAKGLGPSDAAAAAVVAHADAARLGPERGLVASDVIEALPDALASIS
ncbi:MAG TPA: NAD(P)H-hydrate dehydratase [Gaiellaceae bacterium]|nr:NAD(P)H-hydrate dehydratase [Gaiellaceae bacterium]